MDCVGTGSALAQAAAAQPASAGTAHSSSSTPLEVDETKPTTSLQIRLSDGTRHTRVDSGNILFWYISVCQILGQRQYCVLSFRSKNEASNGIDV